MRLDQNLQLHDLAELEATGDFEICFRKPALIAQLNLKSYAQFKPKRMKPNKARDFAYKLGAHSMVDCSLLHALFQEDSHSGQ